MISNLLTDIQVVRNVNPNAVILTTNGCFDLLHLEHIRILKYAAKITPFVVVLVNDDARVRELKGPGRPINPINDRIEMLTAIEYVWRVISFSEPTPVEMLQLIKPDFHVKGIGYKADDLPEYKTVLNNDGCVLIYSGNPEYSTTKLIERIKQNE